MTTLPKFMGGALTLPGCARKTKQRRGVASPPATPTGGTLLLSRLVRPTYLFPLQFLNRHRTIHLSLVLPFSAAIHFPQIRILASTQMIWRPLWLI